MGKALIPRREDFLVLFQEIFLFDSRTTSLVLVVANQSCGRPELDCGSANELLQTSSCFQNTCCLSFTAPPATQPPAALLHIGNTSAIYYVDFFKSFRMCIPISSLPRRFFKLVLLIRIIQVFLQCSVSIEDLRRLIRCLFGFCSFPIFALFFLSWHIWKQGLHMSW